MTHLGLLLSFTLATVLPRPPSGVQIDETRTVSTVRGTPKACFAFSGEGGSLLVEGGPILKAASLRPRKWQTEPERVAYIYSMRARELISGSAPGLGPYGCRLISPSVSMDALTLLVQEAEAGRAAALNAKKSFASAILVRYAAETCGALCGMGMITLWLPGAKKPLLAVMWWQS